MLSVQELSDRMEIADLLTRYTRAIDTGDWALLDRVFSRHAHIDYQAAGGIAGDRETIKAWLSSVLPKYGNRQHLLGQIEVRLDGDRAEATAYFLNPMQLGDSEPLKVWGGYYHHQLHRTDKGWRSIDLLEEIVWKY